MPADPWIVLAAAGLEGVLGYPARLHRLVPHPVAWIGAALRRLEALNRGGDIPRRLAGVFVLLLVAGTAALAGWLIGRLVDGWALILTIAAGSLGLAARSLYAHVAAVSRALNTPINLPAARAAVGMIVGRDTADLDEAGVSAAALESLAESFNDGVVAPLFWFLLGGLAGLFAYKAVNTADSLIGHREEPWRCFGWAAARADDLANLVPARLAGLLLCLAVGGWRIMFRDAGKHASPNAGWPEAAIAGALGLRLAGPIAYDGVMHAKPWIGDGRTNASAHDIRRALRLYVLACLLLWPIAGGLAWAR